MNGEKVFQTICMACHQSQGQGLPGAFPPLAGSEWALGNSKIPIKIVLKGLSGPIEVKGNTYNGAMPPFGPQLKDEEIAAALTYVRSSWGNNASEVKTSEVEAIRREIFSRTQSWTAAELKE
jgi:mono/diheme cytochrome c family protein